MAKLDIAKAARAVRKSRGTLYKYIKEGKLTCDVTEKGHKVIDSAELLRVFGELETDGSINQVDTIVRRNEPSDRSEIEQLLRDRIRDLEETSHLIDQKLSNYCATGSETWKNESRIVEKESRNS